MSEQEPNVESIEYTEEHTEVACAHGFPLVEPDEEVVVLGEELNYDSEASS